jgi:N-methylhydantoinase A
VTPDDLAAWFGDLVAEGRETLADGGIDPDAMTFERALDLRYAGQSYSLTVPVADTGVGTDADLLGDAAERFHERHAAQYGHANPEEPVELVNARVRAVGEIPDVDVRSSVAGSVDDAVLGERPVGFDDDTREVTVYEHARLPPGSEFDGPAVVQADAATTVVHPGQSVTVDERGTLHVSTTHDQP